MSGIAEVAALCVSSLQQPSCAEALSCLGSLATPVSAYTLLSRVAVTAESAAEIGRLAEASGSESVPGTLERTLLVLAAQHVLTKLPDLRVSDAVKALFLDEFRFYGNPAGPWVGSFTWNDVRFREMARIVTLRRFPAGQFHWEMAGVPRSWVMRARAPLQLLRGVARMGGFAPVFEMHLNARRKNRLVLLESEANRSYYRAARSMERQPGVRALMMASWLFCESTSRVTPRLHWLRGIPLAGGAVIVDVGPASPDSGFATGSEERRRLYDEGIYRPQMGCVLWPRKDLLRWADAHPEFDA